MSALPPLYISKDELNSFNTFMQSLLPHEHDALQTALAIYGPQNLDSDHGILSLQKWLLHIILQQQIELRRVKHSVHPPVNYSLLAEELIEKVREELIRVYGKQCSALYQIIYKGKRFYVCTPILSPDGIWESGEGVKQLTRNDFVAWLRVLQSMESNLTSSTYSSNPEVLLIQGK